MKKPQFFSWYPGHIAKAERDLRTKWLPLVDIIIELVDARVPITGRYIDRDIFRNKPVITIYTKGDITNLRDYNLDENLIIDSRNNKWKSKLSAAIKKAGIPVFEKLKKQGRTRKLRIGICGFPNVGKSTFLNSLLGTGKKARTGNLPGVTRHMQFITGLDFDLLDTPGICPVKIPYDHAYKLAICNLLPEKLFDKIELAYKLNKILLEKKQKQFKIEGLESAELLINKFRKGNFRIILDDIQAMKNDNVAAAELS